jgi:hypothetical protein
LASSKSTELAVNLFIVVPPQLHMRLIASLGQMVLKGGWSEAAVQESEHTGATDHTCNKLLEQVREQDVSRLGRDTLERRCEDPSVRQAVLVHVLRRGHRIGRNALKLARRHRIQVKSTKVCVVSQHCSISLTEQPADKAGGRTWPPRVQHANRQIEQQPQRRHLSGSIHQQVELEVCVVVASSKQAWSMNSNIAARQCKEQKGTSPGAVCQRQEK